VNEFKRLGKDKTGTGKGFPGGINPGTGKRIFPSVTAKERGEKRGEKIGGGGGQLRGQVQEKGSEKFRPERRHKKKSNKGVPSPKGGRQSEGKKLTRI